MFLSYVTPIAGREAGNEKRGLVGAVPSLGGASGGSGRRGRIATEVGVCGRWGDCGMDDGMWAMSWI